MEVVGLFCIFFQYLKKDLQVVQVGEVINLVFKSFFLLGYVVVIVSKYRCQDVVKFIYIIDIIEFGKYFNFM